MTEPAPITVNLPDAPEGYFWRLQNVNPFAALFGANATEMMLKLLKHPTEEGMEPRPVDRENVGTRPEPADVEHAALTMLDRFKGRDYQRRIMDAVNNPGGKTSA